MKKLLIITLAMFAISTSSMAQQKLPGEVEFIPGKWMKDGKMRLGVISPDSYDEGLKAIEIYNTDLEKTHTITAREFESKYEERSHEYKSKYFYVVEEELGMIDSSNKFDELTEGKYSRTLEDGTQIFTGWSSDGYLRFTYNTVEHNIYTNKNSIYLKPNGSYGKCTVYEVSYYAYYGDFKENTSHEYDLSQCVTLRDQDDCRYDVKSSFASETFFNDDAKLEYVRLKYEKVDLYEVDIYQDDPDIPEEFIPYLATKEEVFGGNEHWYHVSGYIQTGYEVVNEDGEVLYTLNVPFGEEFGINSKYGEVDFIKNGDNLLAIINCYYHSYIYDLSKSSNAVKTVRNFPKDSGKRYNLAGQPVSESFKGIVIRNGRKFIQK